jgi:hypothetical protein
MVVFQPVQPTLAQLISKMPNKIQSMMVQKTRQLQKEEKGIIPKQQVK